MPRTLPVHWTRELIIDAVSFFQLLLVSNTVGQSIRMQYSTALITPDRTSQLLDGLSPQPLSAIILYPGSRSGQV